MIVVLGISFFFHRKRPSPAQAENSGVEELQMKSPSLVKPHADPPQQNLAGLSPSPSPAPSFPPTRSSNKKMVRIQQAPKGKALLPYVLEDGLVVVQGDLVVGAPVDENPQETGSVEVPAPHVWSSAVIPYHIDPSLRNPERVRQALALFEGTAVQFVPYTNQKDALVFVDGNGTCKSYVGRIGGHQPIWLPAECGPREIAHEIMHALGFVHEQNRSDRDEFIQVLYENIEEKYKDNFEKLPVEFMRASGLGPFDFESLMIYPIWMFARTGQDTMRTKKRDQRIQPGPVLSFTDKERINRLYGPSSGS